MARLPARRWRSSTFCVARRKCGTSVSSSASASCPAFGCTSLSGVFSSNLGAAMALAVFAILPAAMMLIAAQRYIAAGLTVGSVKG